MKPALLCFSFVVVGLASCTTLENRRDMYCGYGKVCGPYTRMLCKGIPEKETVEIPAGTTDYKSTK